MKRLDDLGFDTVLNRRGTSSYKWDTAEILKENLLPLSVADMDFAVPTEVTQALVNRTEKPIYGYEFGDAGQGFMRINLACPRKTLQEAVKRFVTALNQAQENPPPLETMGIPVASCGCCCS